MKTVIQQLISLLTPGERRQAVGLFVCTLILAFAEVLGIASIMPFITVVSDPAKIETTPLQINITTH